MNRPAFFLFAGKAAWHIGRIADGRCELRPVEAQADPATTAQHARQALLELGYRGGLCLGLASEMAMAARLDCSNLPRKHRRTAMLYRLEEQLPLEAERLTADYVPAAGGSSALGVAVRNDQLRPLIDALQEAGLRIDCICPTALLALWAELAAGKMPHTPPYAIAANDGRFDVLRLVDGVPQAWYSVRTEDDGQLLRVIQTDLLAAPVPEGSVEILVLGQMDRAIADALRQAIPATLSTASHPSVPEAAAAAAADLLAGRPAGWVDLRRDGLSQGGGLGRAGAYVKCAIAAAVVLLAVCCSLLLHRAWRYDGLAQEHLESQASEYRRLYPTGAMPTDVRSRLRSEYARQTALAGAGRQLPAQASALESLRQAISALPPGVKLRVNELRIGSGSVLIEGQALSHSDAQAVSQSLIKAGLAAEPPKTEGMPKGGVSFTIIARLCDSTIAAGKP